MSMRVRGNLAGIKGDQCDCGRRASILHCLACGSTRIYARTGRLHTHMNGETKFVETQLRCQTCGHLFIQDERPFCDAPPVGEKLAAQKVRALAQARKQGEFLRPEDEKLAQILDELTTVAPEIATTVEESLKQTVAAQTEPITEIKYPNGLNRQEYTEARNFFIAEWAHSKRERGQPPTATVEEYIERRFNGEAIPL
jgi:hypothetical protein